MDYIKFKGKFTKKTAVEFFDFIGWIHNELSNAAEFATEEDCKVWTEISETLTDEQVESISRAASGYFASHFADVIVESINKNWIQRAG